MLDAQQVDCLSRIEAIARAKGIGLYMVGGIVRDLLREATVTDCDLDILVDGNAIEFASTAQQELGGALKVFKDFFTAKVSTPSSCQGVDEIDFASARTEIYQSPGALPTVSLAPLAEDLRRRDFSVNAIALPLSVLIDFSRSENSDRALLIDARIDPFNGFADLQTRQIRVLHRKSFVDDPTRIFRAIRYKVRIGGELEKETARSFEEAIKNNAFASISLRRKINELNKLLAESEVIECVESCISLGIVRAAFNHTEIDFNHAEFEKLLRATGFFLSSGREFGQLETLIVMILFGTVGSSQRILLAHQLSLAKGTRVVCEADVDHAEKNDDGHRYSKEGEAYRVILRNAMSAAE